MGPVRKMMRTHCLDRTGFRRGRTRRSGTVGASEAPSGEVDSRSSGKLAAAGPEPPWQPGPGVPVTARYRQGAVLLHGAGPPRRPRHNNRTRCRRHAPAGSPSPLQVPRSKAGHREQPRALRSRDSRPTGTHRWPGSDRTHDRARCPGMGAGRRGGQSSCGPAPIVQEGFLSGVRAPSESIGQLIAGLQEARQLASATPAGTPSQTPCEAHGARGCTATRPESVPGRAPAPRRARRGRPRSRGALGDAGWLPARGSHGRRWRWCTSTSAGRRSGPSWAG